MKKEYKGILSSQNKNADQLIQQKADESRQAKLIEERETKLKLK